MFEDDFRRITLLLYDSTVPTSRLDAELVPYLDPQIRFTDPWQQGHGLTSYRLGAAGFHSMFRFDFEVKQVGVTVDEAQRRGRAMVDGVMNLKMLAPFYTYPLRTLLTYEFQLTGGTPAFRISDHEEMWTFGDMLEAIPGAGWAYKKYFRRAFGYAFLGASYLSARARKNLPAGLAGRA